MSDQLVFLITGSRRGIGRMLAEYYVEQGHEVIGCSRNDTDFRAPNYRHYELDVFDEQAVRRLFFDVARDDIPLDVLINNAGMASMNHALLTPISVAEAMMKTNFLGTFLFCREAAKLMMRRKFGRIVNLGSMTTALNLEGEAVYAASKAAVESLTRILAREFAPFGITVNTVAPTPLRTDMTKGVAEQKLKAALDRQAVKRFAEMRDVLNVVNFYIQPESDYITGQTLLLGGI